MHYLKVSKFRKLSLGLRSHVCYCGVRDERLSETPTGNKGGSFFVSRGQCFTHIGFVRLYLLRKCVYKQRF